MDARRKGPATSVAYWPQLLIVTQVSVVYLFAALSKMQPNFLSGDALLNFVRWEPSFLVLLTLSVLTPVTELFIAIGLLMNRFRGLAVVAGLALHLSIVVMITPTLPLVAFALLCVPSYWLHDGRARLWPAEVYRRRARRPASTGGALATSA